MTRPLDGIRILDFSWVYAGPHGTRYFAALGADVVKVESEKSPDSTRLGGTPPDDVDAEETLNVSSYYNEPNQGKRDIRLNLKSDGGIELAKELAAEADIVIENFSPTFMERVGLDYAELTKVNEDIIYIQMPGYANSGEGKNYRSWGENLQSMAGMDAMNGYPEDPPTHTSFSWPDPTAGIMAVEAGLMALLHRMNGGGGTYIEIPQYELTATYLHKALMQYTMTGTEPEQPGTTDEDGRYVQGVYETDEQDRWTVIAVGNDQQWTSLCEILGEFDALDDSRFATQYDRLENQDEINELVEAWTRQRSPEETRHVLQEAGVPAGIVANERDLMEHDPQLRVREFFSEHDHPEVGVRRFLGIPFNMQECTVEQRSRSPLFGEHTEEVMEDWLQMTEEEISEKKDEEILH